MDFGLYTLKYRARDCIAWALPALADVAPNSVTLAMLPLGAATALAYWYGGRGHPWAYLAGAGLIFGRMFVGTLDGLMAARFEKNTPAGAVLNRAVPEVCDAMYLGALAVARPEWHVAGAAALVGAWLVSFAGTIGTLVGQPVQSVGPAGQTDRLAALQLASVAAFALRARSHVDCMHVFLWWVFAGGLFTTALRLARVARALRSPQPA